MYAMTVTSVDHPLIKRDLSILRDKKTNNHLFRTTLRRISSVMAFEVTRDLRLRHGVVFTPLEKTKGYALADDIVIVPVLRAGLGLVEGFLDFLPEARVGHVGIYRNEKTLEPVDYYSKFPRVLNKGIVMLLVIVAGGFKHRRRNFLPPGPASRTHAPSWTPFAASIRRIENAGLQCCARTRNRTAKKNGPGHAVISILPTVVPRSDVVCDPQDGFWTPEVLPSDHVLLPLWSFGQVSGKKDPVRSERSGGADGPSPSPSPSNIHGWLQSSLLRNIGQSRPGWVSAE